MSPHKSTDISALETSETESFSSEQSRKNKQKPEDGEIDQEISLDALFSELSKENQQLNNLREEELVVDNEDNFKKIQKSISRLPKIESSLEKNLEIGAQAQKNTKHSDITRIYDPITVKQKVESSDSMDSGSKWFNMKLPEMTALVKRDLQVIQQRSALDPKRHYKKDKWSIPKYFQMGTIIEGNTEFYSARLSRKQRGTTLVDEILHDDDTKKYFKRKYSEIQDKKTSGRKGNYKKVKEMRKRY